MKLVPVKVDELSCYQDRRAHCRVIKMVEAFMKSDHEAVEIVTEAGEYSCLSSIQSTFRKAIKAAHANCIVMSRKGRVYLIKGGVFND